MAGPAPGEAQLRVRRQEQFALGVVQGLSRWEAYVAAGYTGAKDCGGPSILAKRPGVQDRIDFLMKRVETRVVNAAAVTRSEIIEGLRDNVRLAKAGTPTIDKQGNPTDVYKPDLSAANRGLEILAKMHGMMLDVTREETLDDLLEDLPAEEIRPFLVGLLDQLDPNMSKQKAIAIEKGEVIDVEAEPSGQAGGQTIQ